MLYLVQNAYPDMVLTNQAIKPSQTISSQGFECY
jgi:hypothetical protein